jgi:UDP:flavonoid glycosyltransferase YjiC (YdhE family)
VAKVVVVSAGYWGDVMPFVPIADELVTRGHEVVLAVPEGFHEVLADNRFDLVHVGAHFSPRELQQHGDLFGRAHTIAGMRAVADQLLYPLLIQPAREIAAVLTDLDADLFVSHRLTAFLTQLASEPASIPLVLGDLFPMGVPSVEQPMPLLPLPRLPSLQYLTNRAGWAVYRRIVARMFYDDIGALRAERGLPQRRPGSSAWYQAYDQILLLCSEHYWPRCSDWPDHLAYTGFTVRGDPNAALPTGLDAYLDAGDPPVLITLGTSAATNACDAFPLAAEATEVLGLRSLLLVGSERNLNTLHGRADAWTFAPLPAVLPRCQAVVHAAGHGTIAAALTAGTPQVAMPKSLIRSLTAHG